jgi:hypothetical protein
VAHKTAPIEPCPAGGRPCRRPQFSGHLLLGGLYSDDGPRAARLADFRCGGGGALASAVLRDPISGESSMSERPFFARALKATVAAPQHAEVGFFFRGGVSPFSGGELTAG